MIDLLKEQPPIPWLFIAFGLLFIAGAIFKELPTKLRRPPHWLSLFIGSLLTATGLYVLLVIPPPPPPPPPPTPTPVPTLTPPPPTPSAAPTLLPSATPTCPYATNNPAETHQRLIQAEADAANMGGDAGLAIIQTIFAPDATIRDDDTGQVFTSPEAYYGDLYRRNRFFGVRHVSIVPLGAQPSRDVVSYQSVSEGSYAGLGTATPAPFNVPPPMDHWTLSRERTGCWEIIEFTFNIR